MANSTFPVYNFKYTAGLNNALGADLAYQRVDVGVSQQFVLGKLGKTYYRLEAGKIFCPPSALSVIRSAHRERNAVLLPANI